MAEPSPERRLLPWALGSFHTSFFVLVLIVVLVTSGAIEGLLSGLNTLLGFAFFALLWFAVWWATRRGLQGLDLSDLEHAGIASLLRRAVGWGSVAGVLFLAALGALLLVIGGLDLALRLARGKAAPAPDAGAIVLLVGIGLPIAAIVACVIGGLVGGILGLLDAAALLGTRALIQLAVRRGQRRDDEPS